MVDPKLLKLMRVLRRAGWPEEELVQRVLDCVAPNKVEENEVPLGIMFEEWVCYEATSVGDSSLKEVL